MAEPVFHVDTVTTVRSQFARAHPERFVVSDTDHAAVGRYLSGRGLLPAGTPVDVERAGAGNMNLTLRVRARDEDASWILKQGLPWVEKYDHIAAPPERTVVEARFYETVRAHPRVATAMPALIDADPANRILILEDLGPGRDCTGVYGGEPLRDDVLDALVAYLRDLGDVTLAADAHDNFSSLFTNRAMRALNHEHIFRFPLDPHNGLDLDAFTPGLAAASASLRSDPHYARRAREMGERYLADEPTLVHGDYFPGSWLLVDEGVRVIDPEFCFLGAREFDAGVMIAHLALSLQPEASASRVFHALAGNPADVLGFAGLEIMRRLIGVAQLPLSYGLETKSRLLDLSRSLTLHPDRGLTWL